MRIAYVSDAIYPYNKGGKEKRLYELSTRLAKSGHDVHIYTMHWWKTGEQTRIENGVHLHAISRYYPMYRDNKRSIKEAVLFSIACLKLLRVDFDILDVDHMPFFPVISAWFVCLLRGKRLFGTWHESLATREWVNYMGKVGYISALIERLTIALPYRITAASEQTKRLLWKYHKREKRVEVVASGIDLSVIEAVRPADTVCDVLYVGRLVKDKNVDLLIQAMRIAVQTRPELRCIIIGHGVEYSRLKNLIMCHSLDEHVRLLKPLKESSEVYAYMKQAKVFALPSAREGFGIVALEALACGTPVITSNSAANAAKDLIIDHETGSIIELNDHQIADAILYWAATEKKEIKEKFTTYDWDILAGKQAEIYAHGLELNPSSL